MKKILCSAIAKSTGKPCRRQALENGKCKNHGGKSTGPKDKERHRESLKGNKNALKTGEYETISFDALLEEEQELIKQVSDDPKELLKSNIGILEIRQRRILLRYAVEKQKKKPNSKLLNSLEEALTRLSGKELDYIRELHNVSNEITDEDNGSLDALVAIIGKVRDIRIGAK